MTSVMETDRVAISLCPTHCPDIAAMYMMMLEQSDVDATARRAGIRRVTLTDVVRKSASEAGSCNGCGAGS